MSAGERYPEGRGSFIRMDFNEGPAPGPDLLSVDLGDCLSRYPEYGALKECAARAYGVEPECLVPVNGADEGILLLQRILAGGGMVLPVPAFSMYRVYADQLGVPITEVPMDADWDLDVEGVLAAEGSMVALTSPNNPTGRRISEEALLRILAQGRPVLLDETYGPYCGQDFAGLLGAWPNLVIVRTLSKAYGVPGLRCGFILASRELAERLDAVRSPFNVNAVAAALGVRLLERDTRFGDRVSAAVAARRALQDRLEGAGYRTIPSDAHFFLAELGPGAAARLREANILVRDMGPSMAGWCRVSVASTADAACFETAFLGGRP
ncbi:pyridoxal phosphate-dependent aminotransferase [Mesoterricola silvestris]|uniref:Histidinol-phosphate aminotransferase n=1 Tax=Mesoterricola silvestris TaxID=2927979 RepID=A0AA48GPE0_9BACT|nr:histidinol-phosphate transaminase [Mesoterricola silvestris]BDU71715.1 histidinol-phosphate aminotransferase [Mesoterricola silvestris]